MAQVVVLKIYKGDSLVEEKQLDQSHIVLGSSATETHVSLAGTPSPIHASIEKREDQYYICDLGSESGTFKNGDKILEALLTPGDKVIIGEYSIEFFLQERVVVAPVTTGTSFADDSDPTEEVPTSQIHSAAAPLQQSTPGSVVQSGGMETISSSAEGFSSSVGAYKSITDFIRPTKGTTVEVLVAWRERVISAHHFTDKGVVTVGTHPSCDVIVPLIASNANKIPLIRLTNQVQITLYPGLQGTLVSDQQTVTFDQLSSMGRGGGAISLQQGEMARVQVGGEVEIVVRYASQAPKPVIIPFIDLSSNGFLAILLAVVLSGILSLWVALNRLDNIDKLDEEEFRTALIITNPPKPPPQVKIKLPPPKKEKPKKQIKKIVKLTKEKPKPKNKSIAKLTKKTKKKRKRVTKKRGGNARARGSGNEKSAKAMRKKDGKKSSKVTSVKQGGAVKTAKKQGAQAQSERKLKKSGIFSAFGGGGRNDRIDKSYSGNGELAGLADQASGSAGFADDRAGSGLGSKFKDTGAGGQGKSNVGVSGLKRGKGLGAGGLGSAGLGGKKSVEIIPGGSGEEFSGQIDKEGIRKVFYDNQRAIRSCYERELNQDPNLSGILKLNFDIGQHGRVVGSPSINWGDSSLKNRAVAGCILNRLKTWRFPEPPRNQVVNVLYPLAFSAK